VQLGHPGIQVPLASLDLKEVKVSLEILAVKVALLMFSNINVFFVSYWASVKYCTKAFCYCATLC